MNSFDSRAREWDTVPLHIERSEAIAAALVQMVPLNSSMKALEFGAGTGMLSFLLRDRLSEITLIDNSAEMIKVCEEKVAFYGTTHFRPLCLDLEHTDIDQKFDIIFNQMVLHHITDVEAMLRKFYKLLNPGGFLVVADLYAEDGSFHGPEVKVHHGFEPAQLIRTLEAQGFSDAKYQTCFVIKRDFGKEYPVFLLFVKK